MNGYSYNGGFRGEGMPQNQPAAIGPKNDMMMMDAEGNMAGGQSLDDIVNQNAKEIRRQSLPQHYGASPNKLDTDMRRISMMDYNGPSTAAMSKYPYDASHAMDQSGMMMNTHGNQPNLHMRNNTPSRQNTLGEMSVNTNFGPSQNSYSPMMPHPSIYAQSPVAPNLGMDMPMANPYNNPNMSMDFGLDPGINKAMPGNAMNMTLYDQPQFNASMTSPMPISTTQHINTLMSTRGASNQDMDRSSSNSSTPYTSQNMADQSGSTVRAMSQGTQNSQLPHASTPQPQPQQGHLHQPTLSRSHASRVQQQEGSNFTSSSPLSTSESRADSNNSQKTQTFDGKNGPIPIGPTNPPAESSKVSVPWETPEGGWPSTMAGKPHTQSIFKNAYSSTGFDMLGVLMRVSTRKNPEINIGAVDLSCAFVVCDVQKDDAPIVYCSENFERLTGYTKHMILGRNCRFLQSPDGNVAPGVRRKYVDDDSVLYLKNMVTMRREAQISVINYRRGGQPFMNLLTMIPISWDASDEVRFFVGFQVDLVEQPNAVTNKNPDGSYVINYQRGMTMPRYVMQAPDSSHKIEQGQTVPRDDVSAILATINSGESDYAKRMWDKVLLENTDDVVHVLSLKGLFQWISPSAARVLEYEPTEIIGTALSSVCHPSDIVPVTRELKDTSNGASVNVVFRIRRKHSGYMWFEGHGSLHTEQAKGRKSIIMVGRERPVYTLSKTAIASSGGIGENELWSKMSTSGMFLFVSQNVRQLLDRQADELVGISIQTLMRAESKAEFGRILEHARTGKRASVKHEMINKRGQVLSAYTTLYPGDASEGQKPTFIVAQTRLIKFSRSSHSGRPNMYNKNERYSADSIHSGSQNLSMQPSPSGVLTPSSGLSSGKYLSTDGAAATYGGQQGLVLGHQDQSLASEDNLFDELKTTKSSSWQYEIRQLEKKNRALAEEVQALIAAKKKRKRRKGAGNSQKDCANCHTKNTPEWRRGPSGERDLCNSCGLRWAKLNGRVSPRTNSNKSQNGPKQPSVSPEAISNAPKKSAAATEMSPSSFDNGQSMSCAAPDHGPDGHAATMQGAFGVPGRITEVKEPE
ncbi:White collar 1 protein [Acrodontium crateriforme]|uniref:White collar 1 protein n=1 Tax=Acrodontium crateriforme TaxID=150365 RepID=A0AAQ3MDP5_9PEZI|nr:White collar 1 protein [Acrodontium crateriforme]